VLRARIPASGRPPVLHLEGQTFPASPDLACFYQRRDSAPAWSDGQRLSPATGDLLDALAAAEDDGLRPDDYRLAALQRLVDGARRGAGAGSLAELDLVLSDAFLTFAADLSRGRVNPSDLYRDCGLEPSASDLAAALQAALGSAAGSERVRQTLAGLAPPQAGYQRLREALQRYRKLGKLAAGLDLPPVPAGPTLHPKDQGERVALLRERLAWDAQADADAPVPPPEGDPARFDAGLAQAVRAFQERHGLSPDGAVGKGTLAEINAGPAEHVRQIELNLERWRWMPRDLGDRNVLVNIAGFRLTASEEGRTALEMRVIVGKPYTRTPMFNSRMTTVVLNPSWYVPRSIVVKEIIPRSRRDPGYIAREGFQRLPNGLFRQPPGEKNALGRIKFLFPNRFGVYLHDTPSRSLFGQTVRTFSHGCIRIEKPLDLAAWVLRDDPRWTPEAIQAGIAAGREKSIALSHPVAVHVAYWSAWVDDRGTLQIGRDVYGRDAPLERALRPTPVASPAARGAAPSPGSAAANARG
jgi:murein L,D-transpeptidase YcbB/YkuD